MLKIEKNNDDVDHLQPMSINEKDSPSIGHSDPGSKKGVRSERQLEASRRNGRRSRGPRNTDRTRLNALKHGLRAQGLTAADDVGEYEQNIGSLMDKYNSSDPIERFMIQQMALEMTRMRRMDRLEADNITAISAPPDVPGDMISDDTPKIHFAVVREYANTAFDLPNRYKTATMNRFLRYRRELDRIPREEPSSEGTKHIG
jgi:hypothetical protein